MFTTQITVHTDAPAGAHVKIKMLLGHEKYAQTRKLEEHTVFVELPVSMYWCRHHATHVEPADISIKKQHHAEICARALDFLNAPTSKGYAFSSIGPEVELVLADADAHRIAVQHLWDLVYVQDDAIRTAELNLAEAKRTSNHYRETILMHERCIKDLNSKES